MQYSKRFPATQVSSASRPKSWNRNAEIERTKFLHMPAQAAKFFELSSQLGYHYAKSLDGHFEVRPHTSSLSKAIIRLRERRRPVQDFMSN